MKPWLSVLLIAVSVLAPCELRAEESVEPTPTAWKQFELGGFLQGAVPGSFTPTLAGSQGFGLGLGYGFTFGWRPLPYFTLTAMLDGIMHSVDVPSTTDAEHASNAGIGVGVKIFPLGEDEPRLYALFGIGITNFWVHDRFTIFPNQGEGASYRGHRFSFGAGYEHPFHPSASLLAEVDLTNVTLTERTFKDSPSVTLTTNSVRWVPTVRVGCLVHL